MKMGEALGAQESMCRVEHRLACRHQSTDGRRAVDAQDRRDLLDAAAGREVHAQDDALLRDQRADRSLESSS